MFPGYHSILARQAQYADLVREAEHGRRAREAAADGSADGWLARASQWIGGRLVRLGLCLHPHGRNGAPSHLVVVPVLLVSRAASAYDCRPALGEPHPGQQARAAS